MNHEIQQGDRSTPYALCVYLQDGVRYVVAGYMHGEVFFKTIFAAGFLDGESESDLVNLIVNWFCSSEYEARLPIAITNDGSVGGVNQFILNVGVELDRPILQLTFVDELWLIDTLHKSFGASANPWSVFWKRSGSLLVACVVMSCYRLYPN